MATPNTRNTAPTPAVEPFADPTANWTTIQDHRPMWMADQCSRRCTCTPDIRIAAEKGLRPHTAGCPAQVRGWLLGTKEMNPSNKNVKTDVPIEEQYWIALVVLLTEPTLCRSPEKEFRVYEAGTQVLVGGYDLGSLYTRADNMRLCYEAIFWPTSQLDLGGRKLWLFSKKVNPTAVPRAPGGAYEFLEGRAAEKALDPFLQAQQLAQGPAARAALPAAPQPQTVTAPVDTAAPAVQG